VKANTKHPRECIVVEESLLFAYLLFYEKEKPEKDFF